MAIEDIKQTELTQSERDVLAEDKARWRRMGEGGHLDDWLAYYPGLSIRRRLAMKVAYTNKPEGKGYNQYYGQLMQADGLDPKDKSWSHVLWLRDDPEREKVLREIRETMTPGERSRLNSPVAARQRVEKLMKARESGGEEKMRSSPVTILKSKLVESERTIAHLEERLASAERRLEDGSLFDLKRDTADHIINAIIANISANKALAIFKGGFVALNNKKKPAG